MSTKRFLTIRDWPKREKLHCRVCDKAVPKPRRTMCSQECVDRLTALHSLQRQRRLVWDRDKGICQGCGFDMGRLHRICEYIRENYYDVSWEMWSIFEKMADWEADHIVPVCEGGGVTIHTTIEQLLANLRLLCLICHKAETKKLAARRAMARKRAG